MYAPSTRHPLPEKALPGPRFTATVAVAALLSPLAPSNADAVQASREVRDAASHVVTLRAYDADGGVTAQGSGFFFGPGRIATNYHVVEGAALVRVIGAAGDTVLTTTHAEAADERLDLVILPAPSGKARGLTIETFFPDVGDPVWTYGSPKGLTGTMSNGIVSAVRKRSGRTVLQISAPISPGSSGGPVLDTRGRVVGVTVSSVRGGQNLNFAVPARELARLAARGGDRVRFPIGEPRRGARADEGEVVGVRPELPERWQYLARNVSDAELYFDRESLGPNGDRLRVWVYAFYPETLMAGEAAFDSSKALFELRCDRREFRLNQYLLLRGERVIGSNGSVSGGEWSAVAPESIAENLMGSVCSSQAAAAEDQSESLSAGSGAASKSDSGSRSDSGRPSG